MNGAKLIMWCKACDRATEHERTMKGKRPLVRCRACRKERPEAADRRVPNVFPKGRGF